MMRLLTLVFCATAAFAAEYLPLQDGNYWTYRDLASGQSFTIKVGTPLATMDGNVYYSLSGYVDRKLWVRALEDGTLVYLDEDSGVEKVLTSFREEASTWAEAPFRPCPEQESQIVSKSEPYTGPLGRFPNALTLRYRSFSCADVGVESEVYLPNVGMLSRTHTTIAGPRVLELSEGKVGHITLAFRQEASFDVSLNEAPEGKLRASLRLMLTGDEPLYLLYNDSQEYDLVLWNDNGNQIYRWSDGQAFTQAVRSKTIRGGLRHDVLISTPEPLPDGHYLLEAWLKTGPSQRSFAAMAPFLIVEGRLVR